MAWKKLLPVMLLVDSLGKDPLKLPWSIHCHGLNLHAHSAITAICLHLSHHLSQFHFQAQ